MIFSIRRALGASSGRSGRAFPAPLSLVAAAAAFIVLAPVSEAQAEFRQSEGSRIAVDLGDAFTPADNFSGFLDKNTGVSFAVIELPADAYDKLKTLPDSKEALEKEGFGGTEKAELKDREGTFIYLVGKQTTPAGDVTKFVLIFKEGDATGLIVVNVPQDLIDTGAYSRQAVEAILATAAVREPPDRNALFRFTYMGSYKEAFDHGGMTKAYNMSGSQPGTTDENQLLKEPLLLVSSSIHGDDVDAKTLAKKSFMELGGMKDPQIDAEKEIAIGEFKGYQITGEATDGETGNKIAINLVLLSGSPFGNFMLLGSTPAADKAKMMPELEKVMTSFEVIK